MKILWLFLVAVTFAPQAHVASDEAGNLAGMEVSSELAVRLRTWLESGASDGIEGLGNCSTCFI